MSLFFIYRTGTYPSVANTFYLMVNGSDSNAPSKTKFVCNAAIAVFSGWLQKWWPVLKIGKLIRFLIITNGGGCSVEPHNPLAQKNCKLFLVERK